MKTFKVPCGMEMHQIGVDEEGTIHLCDHDIDEEETAYAMGDRASRCFQLLIRMEQEPEWLLSETVHNRLEARLGILAAAGLDLGMKDGELLHLAARTNWPEGVKILLDAGVNPDIKHGIALRTAAEEGYIDVVRHLLEHDADVHCIQDEALRMASAKGLIRIVKELLNHGADVHALGDAAWNNAMKYGHGDIAELLLKAM